VRPQTAFKKVRMGTQQRRWETTLSHFPR
jgi:hypothetical protein